MQKFPLLRVLFFPLILVSVISLITRIGLAVYADLPLVQYPTVLLFGSYYDLLFVVYFLVPIILITALFPNKLIATKFGYYFILIFYALLTFILLFVAVAEFVFWEEFAARFNFIAVDYLVYTNEVVGNIWQSYPVGKILIAIFIFSLLIVFLSRKFISSSLNYQLKLSQRFKTIIVALFLPIIVFFITGDNLGKDRLSNDLAIELAGNGPYQFFSAFRANDLDFLRFYRSVPNQQAFQKVSSMRSRLDMLASNQHKPSDQISYQIPKSINKLSNKPVNIILVSVESLGAEFIGSWGNQKNITPNLDKLSNNSLVFKRVYATGNRTVRGLEALSIALPPTPGQSIVKRQNNDNLYTLGGVLKQANYQAMFIYGGYGYFDNMNNYFHNNGYLVKDRLEVAKDKIHFENIWGIADEDLYSYAIEQIENTMQQQNQAIFAHIMTTSNHRPYTYPANRVDIPSGTGRDGAVKYTDWALGQFIEKLEKKSWFKDTILVITADHGANARGSQQIPVDKYLIPLWIYNPNLIKPRSINRLMSQIDIAPTLLGLLGISYENRFFGKDVLNPNTQAAEYAFVGNYQALGYLRDGRLIILLPKKQVKIINSPDAIPSSQSKLEMPLDDLALTNEAIAWYQTAFISYQQGLMKKN